MWIIGGKLAQLSACLLCTEGTLVWILVWPLMQCVYSTNMTVWNMEYQHFLAILHVQGKLNHITVKFEKSQTQIKNCLFIYLYLFLNINMPRAGFKPLFQAQRSTEWESWCSNELSHHSWFTFTFFIVSFIWKELSKNQGKFYTLN